jgi:hypothetical protein
MMGLANTTNRAQTSHICIDDVAIYIDGICIRCDKQDHPLGRCTIRSTEWLDSLRCQLLRGLTLDQIVYAIRRDRAIIAMGRSQQ